MKFDNLRTAIVYDRVNKWGGAERVLLALHAIFPKAELFTSVYNPQTARWANVFNVKTSFLQKIPFAKTSHGFLGTFMPLAFESFNFDDYDLVISVTSEAAKGIITKPSTLHICYCLTPTRYLWSGYKIYFKNVIFKVLALPAVSYLRKWEQVAAGRPDKFIAISKDVQARIKKYYKRDSEIIFPPLPINSPKPQIPYERDYFLIVSRLVPYKNIDIAINVFNKLGLHLKIVGTGWEENRLKKMANNNIQFLKNLSDSELFGLYLNCNAFVFPANEDFGLSMAEAQSFGKPVIALKAGGALDIIKEGKTGEFFEDEKSLTTVLENFKDSRYNKEAIIENSKRFTFENFKKQLLELIENNL